jgi:hypothetical protein
MVAGGFLSCLAVLNYAQAAGPLPELSRKTGREWMGRHDSGDVLRPQDREKIVDELKKQFQEGIEKPQSSIPRLKRRRRGH